MLLNSDFGSHLSMLLQTSDHTFMFLQNTPFPVASDVGFGFASYYASHMVLQRAPSQAVIWGYAVQDGDPVTLTVDTEVYSTTAAMGETYLFIYLCIYLFIHLFYLFI
jgi:hypothetical protein